MAVSFRVQYASSGQMSSRSVKCLRRYGAVTFFFKMAAVRHYGFVGRNLDTQENYMWVSIVVQNLAGIDAAVSVTWNF